MKLYRNMFRLSLMTLVFILSACSQPEPYNVVLTPDRPHPAIKSDSNLDVVISSQFKNSQYIGGHDSIREINFQEIFPWLENRLFSINALNCKLTQKTKVYISVKKLYATIDSEVPVGVLVLHARIVAADGTVLIRNYRGDCKMGFLVMSEQQGYRACFNSSLNTIIANIKNDICHMASN